MNNQRNSRYTPKNFIKGKIVELVFEQMFRKVGKFTVIPFGYERTLPEIAQHVQTLKFQHVLDNIRTSPDFALINPEKTEVFLVEVKYRANKDKNELKDRAVEIRERWTGAWLFVATQDGFYFNSCTKVIENNGEMTLLKFGWVPEEIQKEYLDLMKEFIK